MTEQQWGSYLRRISGNQSGQALARKLGVSGSKVSYWLRGERRPTPSECVHVSRLYDRPPLEGLVAAGLLTPEEAGLGETVHVELGRELSEYLSFELLDELRRREPSPVR